MAWADEYPCIAVDPPWWETGGGRIKRGADKHYSLIKTKEMPRVILQAPCWRPADDAHLWMWVTNRFLPDGLWLMDALGFRYVTNRAWAKLQSVGLHPDDDPRAGPWMPQKPGLGQYLRGQHELLLFGVRGTLPARWKGHSIAATRQATSWNDAVTAYCALRARLGAADDDAVREEMDDLWWRLTNAERWEIEHGGELPKAPGTLLLAPRGEHSEKPALAYEEMGCVSPGPRLEMFARNPRPGWDVWGDEVAAESCSATKTHQLLQTAQNKKDVS